MTSEGLWEMFEGDFAEKCGNIFSLASMGAAERSVCVPRHGSEDPIVASRNVISGRPKSELKKWPAKLTLGMAHERRAVLWRLASYKERPMLTHDPYNKLQCHNHFY